MLRFFFWVAQYIKLIKASFLLSQDIVLATLADPSNTNIGIFHVNTTKAKIHINILGPLCIGFGATIKFIDLPSY